MNPIRKAHENFKTWLWGPSEPVVNPEVQKVSHKLANDAQALSYNLKRIADAPDPVLELVKTMRGNGHNHGSTNYTRNH
jgi:hypothetical protein